MIENRLPMLSQGQGGSFNPFQFQNPDFFSLNPNNRNISATPSEGLSLEKMHSPYAGLSNLSGPFMQPYMFPMQGQTQATMPQTQQATFGQTYTPQQFGYSYPMSPIGSLLPENQPQQQAQPSAVPNSFGGIDPSIEGWGWDSTRAPGYQPPTFGQYGAGLWDFFSNQMPWTVAGVVNQLMGGGQRSGQRAPVTDMTGALGGPMPTTPADAISIAQSQPSYGGPTVTAPSGQSVPSNTGTQINTAGNMWGTPFSDPSFDFTPDVSGGFDFDPGGWGGGYGTGAF